jgi:CRISPR-associated protein Cmr2
VSDYYAWIAEQRACPQDARAVPRGLASGFVDGCTAWSASPDGNAKNDARRCYIKHVDGKTGLSLPPALKLAPDFECLPDAAWLGLEVAFTLATPWYSKDDRPFHVLDNPVRKDRVFGVPFMAAASWKGLLRWACRMRGMERDQILHLFGNEKGEAENFLRGALAFYPTWFDRLGFEVINPHSRKTRAGTQPIYYEVASCDCSMRRRPATSTNRGRTPRPSAD